VVVALAPATRLGGNSRTWFKNRTRFGSRGSSPRCASRLFVHAVAGELVELGAEEVARRLVERPRLGKLLVREPHGDVRRFGEADGVERPREARAEPPAKQRRLGTRAGELDLLVADVGPVLRELEAPAFGPAPGDVRDGGMFEDPRQLVVAQVVPLLRVDDQPVDD